MFVKIRLVPLLLALPALVPLAVIVLSFLKPAPEVWGHLAETVLPRLFANSAILAAGTLAGTCALGVCLAWLTGVCDFPGRKFFSWALMLPLAAPTYVLAFIFLGLFEFAGPVQTALRGWLGPGAPRFNPRGAFGVVLVMSLALYPYVYLLARTGFAAQGGRAMEAARSLGMTPLKAFFRVALPMNRPFIVAGLTLALMETLADFGAVAVFNFDVFTTAVYKAWFALFSVHGAAQLASLLVVFALAVILAERAARTRMRFARGGRAEAEMVRLRLRGRSAWLATGFCGLVLGAAFAVPVVQLCLWTWQSWAVEFDGRYLGYVVRSAALGGLSAFFVCVAAFLLAASARKGRRGREALTPALVRLATLGYGLPGTVLAVGVFIPIAMLDNALIAMAQGGFGLALGPVLQGTLAAMLLGYQARFLAVGFGPIESAWERAPASVEESARLLGATGWDLNRRVILPLLKSGALTAAMLVFVDVMKEMPITLMTRPFGWDTLAVKIFELTSEGEFKRAALPALALVVVGTLPIALLSRGAEGEDE